MNGKAILFALFLLGAGLFGLYSGGETAPTADAVIDIDKARLMPDDADVVARGKVVYGENCAACHGVNLEGEPNWKEVKPDGLLPAPPHDASGHTWHHADKQLFALTKFGAGALLGNPDFKTAMPVYEGILSDQDIIAALSFIKSTWPARERMHQDGLNGR